MTVNPRVRVRARSAPRVIAGLVVGAVVALAGASAATAATDPTPTPSPTAPPPTGGVEDVSATLDSYGPYVVADGQSVAATLTFTNGSALPVPATSASLSVTRAPLTSAADLAEFFTDPAAEPMREVASVPVGTPELDEDEEPLGTGTLTGRGTPQVRVAASADDLALPQGTAGVYGVTVSFRVDKKTVFVNSMALTWVDADIEPLPVTTIATIAGQPSRVATLLNGADIDGVTFAVDPTALTWTAPRGPLEDRESYLLPATNPDVASLAHAQDTALIDFARDQSRTQGWPFLTDRPWLALSAVADRSVTGWAAGADAAATLLDGDHVVTAPDLPESEGLAPAVLSVGIGDKQTAPLVVPDSALSSLVATFRPDDVAGPSRIVAESALLALAGDGKQGVVVSPGLDWIIPGEGPSANLSALMTAPWVEPRTLAEAIAEATPAGTAIRETQDAKQDVPVERVEALTKRLDDLGRIAQTAKYPDSVLGPGGRTLLGAVSAAARGDEEQQTVAFQSAVMDVDATLNAVAIVRNSDVNLIATSGEVPITVRNDLAVDSTVTVVMRSTSPNLQVRDWPVITVPAGGEATAMIPVEAVSSADVALSVRLVNPGGDAISEPQDFTMRVRADWGNAATAVFTGLLVLVMIGGIIRTIRRGRKDTRTGPGVPAEGAKVVDGENHD